MTTKTDYEICEDALDFDESEMTRFCKKESFMYHFTPEKVKKMLDRIAELEHKLSVDWEKWNNQSNEEIQSNLDRAIEVINYYANWRNWDWESISTGDDSKLTNIRNDFSKEDHIENDGEQYTNIFGGKRTREFLKSLGEE